MNVWDHLYRLPFTALLAYIPARDRGDLLFQRDSARATLRYVAATDKGWPAREEFEREYRPNFT
jgi:hypothetical protein